MKCPDCGTVNDRPKATQLLLDEIFEGHIDVDASAQEHLQLECTECGAVLGYMGSGAAIGSSNIRGYYCGSHWFRGPFPLVLAPAKSLHTVSITAVPISPGLSLPEQYPTTYER